MPFRHIPHSARYVAWPALTVYGVGEGEGCTQGTYKWVLMEPNMSLIELNMALIELNMALNGSKWP